MACCTGCKLPSDPNRLSTVTSSCPSIVGRKRMQEFTARYSTRLPSALGSPNTTVQAPQSPSAQPSFVPVRGATSRRYSSTVMVHGWSPVLTNRPSSRKRVPSDLCEPADMRRLSSPIDRVTPGRDQKRYVIVLPRIGDADPDHGLLDEGRLRQRDTASAKVLGHVEGERVTTGAQGGSGEQRRRHAGAAILVHLDAHAGRWHTRCKIKNMRRQLPHRSRC